MIALVMRKEGVSFRRAVDILRQRLGIVAEDPTIETRGGTTHSMLVPPSETELADHALLKHVLDFYHQTLCDDVKAMRYLQQRRCFDPEAVKLFKIGYANRTLVWRADDKTSPYTYTDAATERFVYDGDDVVADLLHPDGALTTRPCPRDISTARPWTRSWPRGMATTRTFFGKQLSTDHRRGPGAHRSLSLMGVLTC